ncbi:MAG: 1-aminocyclopropane-1-carboxylate deaminase/D-cysteine desulfhydrase [Candidatus Tectimicrobiota bacterium]
MTAGDLPPRLPLARTPTPIERLPRLSDRLGVELFVKRDDLTGFLTSGNKVRKLEFLVAEAQAAGCDTLVTCGALQSNHARATAVVARRLGMESVLVLRGEPPEGYPGNLLIARMVGARIRPMKPEAWPQRAAIMEEVAAELRAAGSRPYLIPEGGSNALGACGYVQWVAEVMAQCEDEGLAFDAVVHAVGSGGTSAGLLMGQARYGFRPTVVGIPVCEDAATFHRIIGAILEEAADRFGWQVAGAADAMELVDGYVGEGYGKNRAVEWSAVLDVARTEGLVLDPVYTGKAFFGLLRELEATPGRFGRRLLFVHTGGLFALFPKEPELRDWLRE